MITTFCVMSFICATTLAIIVSVYASVKKCDKEFDKAAAAFWILMPVLTAISAVVVATMVNTGHQF